MATPEWIKYGERATADNDPIYGASGIVNRPGKDAWTNFLVGHDADGNHTFFSAVPAPGRLTLTSATPVTTADVTAATTVYYTPHKGNLIALYSGTAWELSTLAEKSLSLSGWTADKNNDIFLYDNAGTLTLERAEWTNDTTRATALVLQDGIYVKSGATTRRYLGTIRTTSTTGQTEDSISKRFIWNYDNRVSRLLSYSEITASWTYNSQTWQQLRGQTTAGVFLIAGLIEQTLNAHFQIRTANGFIGIGFNSTIAPASIGDPTHNGYGANISIHLCTLPILGFNAVYPLQRAPTGLTATLTGVYDSQQVMYFTAEVLA